MPRAEERQTGRLPCGCHIEDAQRIIQCEYHRKTAQMAGALDMLRRYFIETTGEDSPFVERIDQLIPRRD